MEKFGLVASLTRTHFERNEVNLPRTNLDWNRDWARVLQWRKGIQLEIFLCLLKKSLDPSLNGFSLDFVRVDVTKAMNPRGFSNQYCSSDTRYTSVLPGQVLE